MKIFNFILCILTLAVVVVFGFLDKPVQMGIMILFPIFFGLMVVIEKLDSFKINKDGVSAKLKKLDNEIISLRETLSLFSEMSITGFAYTGNWAEITINEKEKILNKFIQKLESMNITKFEIDRLLEPWHKYILYTYRSKIVNEIDNLFRRAHGKCSEISKILDEYKTESNNSQCVEYIKTYCSEYNLHSDILSSLLSAYEFYVKNKRYESEEERNKIINEKSDITLLVVNI